MHQDDDRLQAAGIGAGVARKYLSITVEPEIHQRAKIEGIMFSQENLLHSLPGKIHQARGVANEEKICLVCSPAGFGLMS